MESIEKRSDTIHDFVLDPEIAGEMYDPSEDFVLDAEIARLMHKPQKKTPNPEQQFMEKLLVFLLKKSLFPFNFSVYSTDKIIRSIMKKYSL